jgi:hypothetical protein
VDRDQHAVTGDLDQRSVNLEIQSQQALGIMDPGMGEHGLVQAAQLVDPGRVQTHRGESARLALQNRDDIEGLGHLVGAQGCDPGASAGPELDQPARSQDLQRLAQRRARDPEILAQAVLLSILIGVPLGVAVAAAKSGLLERIVFFYGMLAGSLPDFWIGPS